MACDARLKAAAARGGVAAALGLVGTVWAQLSTPADANKPPAQAAAAQWQVSASSDRHNDALPLAQMGQHDDFRHLAPRPGRNLAYLSDELRLQRQGEVWGLALLARSQASLVASDQTLELAQRVATGHAPDTDRHWQAQAHLRGFTGAGVELSWRLELGDGLSLALSSQLLALGRLREREISGTVDYQSQAKAYGFDLLSAEANDRLAFPYQQAFARHGTGLLLGARLRWVHGPWQVEAGLRDGGWLRWRGIPRQDNSLVANRQSIDADGFVVYGPLLQGQNSQPALTSHQPWRGQLGASVAIDSTQRLGVSVEQWPDFGLLPAVQWRRETGPLALGLDWRLHERRLTGALSWQGLALRVGADRLDSSARSRTLALSYVRPI